MTSILPFGWKDTQAKFVLDEMVRPRLQKNAKLNKALLAGKKIAYYSSNGEPWAPQMSLPFDGQKLLRLYEFITKGLVFFHWGIYLTDEHIIEVGFFTKEVEIAFEKLLAMNGNKVSNDFGNGTFTYEAVQSAESPTLSVWKMSLYRAQLSEWRDSRERQVTYAYAITGRKNMAAAGNLMRLFRGNRGQ